MGGLGAVLTALTKQQQRDGNVDVSVILPFYSLLRHMPLASSIAHYANLTVSVYPGKGYGDSWQISQAGIAAVKAAEAARDPYTRAERAMQEVGFSVSTMPYWIDSTNSSAVTVYLVGPGDVYPFDQAFHAQSTLDIYGSPGGLPQEWRDLYFEKAAARLIEHIHTEATSSKQGHQQQQHSNGPSAVAPLSRGVDVVHLHGATNAFLAHFLAQRITAGAFDVGGRPGIVYTLHDYSDEVRYLNDASNVDKFLDYPTVERWQLNQYRYGSEVFMSPLGINHADMVTFVSRSLTADLVEGRLEFYMKEIAMDAILTKARDARFIGITNGIDLHARNPFTSPELAREQLTFPRRFPQWPPSHAPMEARIADRKQAAKAYLQRSGLLTKDDLDRPLVLFIGRFQHNKGLEFFAETAEYLAARNARFVMMGQKNNYAHYKVVELRDRYPDNVILIDEEQDQKRWGIYLRTAADFAFVPSRTESFGLVAAEGLLFGAAVISTGVGGLREFLKAKASPAHNAYLFELDTAHTSASLRRALGDALKDHHRLRQDPAAYEHFLEGLVGSSVALGWDQKGGPVSAYNHVYAKAVERARKIPRGGLWR
ncbi:hypothetical protein SYNPS1DRAFT_12796 [Syncephalis pseudoplumigaleata]|uniref:Uncharacterized protein n=1 Tax=Syncephalis pseudoplumigaleata TaxID=1712513 RepID=A0A4P9Z4D2_9FUNG|nr:hypothetical protein SYNPS1DRAFT_12796 [Syncephalis pseudoplumigaleata]|eukprot:RKP27356.1 hypothetical protein SYNPS1DRAFT_12796 [Syncephalis pseudoplumigaleata]